MMQCRIGSHLEQAFHAYAARLAAAREVIAHEIDDHEVFRAVFFASLQLRAGRPVKSNVRRTRHSTLDGRGPHMTLSIDRKKTFGTGGNYGRILHAYQCAI